MRDHPILTPSQIALLEEACRCKDRLDRLDEMLRGEVAHWVTLYDDDEANIVLKVDSVMSHANATSAAMKALLWALKLPDVKAPARTARGGGVGTQKGFRVSSLDQARDAKNG